MDVFCDVIGIVQYHFKKIKDGSHEFCTALNLEALPSKFVFENVGNISEKG